MYLASVRSSGSACVERAARLTAYCDRGPAVESLHSESWACSEWAATEKHRDTYSTTDFTQLYIHLSVLFKWQFNNDSC